MNQVIWIVSGLFFLLGVIFGSIGIYIGKRNRRMEDTCTQQTTAKIVDIIARNNYDDYHPCSVFYHPVFEYYAGTSIHRETSMWGNNPCHYKIGQEVVLIYNPKNPTKYIIKNDNTPKLLNVIFVCVGALLLTLSIFIQIIANLL